MRNEGFTDSPVIIKPQTNVEAEDGESHHDFTANDIILLTSAPMSQCDFVRSRKRHVSTAECNRVIDTISRNIFEKISMESSQRADE